MATNPRKMTSSMFIAHLRAVLWIAWKLSQRRWRYEGALLRSVGTLIAALCLVAGCLSFVLAFGVGIVLVPEFGMRTALVSIEILVLLFLLAKLIGALLSSQRDDFAPLDNFLHLPLAPHQLFALNFVLSQLTLSMVVFGPALLGLAVAFTVALDVRNAMLILTVLALVLCVAALSHELQKWILASILNKRWRASFAYLLVMSLVLLMQIPHLQTQTSGQRDGPHDVGEIDAAPTRSAPNDESVVARAGDYEARRQAKRDESGILLPATFLANGLHGTGTFSPWPPVATVGLLVVAALSLRRSYGRTLALYRNGGPGTSRSGRRDRTGKGEVPLRMFRILASAPAMIALVTLRQWFRSAQGKTVFVLPVFLGVMLALVGERFPSAVDADTLPITFIGAAILAMPLALSSNLFAFDGRGLRLYLMAGVSPGTILIGKYLALLPMYATLAGGLLIAAALLWSFRVDYLVASIFQAGTLFVGSCILGGTLSMKQPYAVAYDSLMTGSSARGILAMLAEIALAAMLILIAIGEMAAERMLREAGYPLPMYALLSALETIVAILFFNTMVSRQARSLERDVDDIMYRVTVD